jgi:hypothetical protein
VSRPKPIAYDVKYHLRVGYFLGDPIAMLFNIHGTLEMYPRPHRYLAGFFGKYESIDGPIDRTENLFTFAVPEKS